MNIKHYTYRVIWSAEDGEHLATCAEFPSLSWLAKTPEAALKGIQKVVAEVVTDMQASGGIGAGAARGKTLQRRVSRPHPPQLHRALALTAAEEGVSLNRLASAKLAA